MNARFHRRIIKEVDEVITIREPDMPIIIIRNDANDETLVWEE